MNQSRLMSLIETITGTAIGFVVSSLAWRFVVAPYWGLPNNAATNFSITAFFTVLSLARGYLVRRFFAQKIHAMAAWLSRVFA